MAFISIDNSCSSSGRTIAIAVAAISISIVAAAIYLRRRRRRVAATERETAASPCCSTELEAKPQYGFKRVLADNSFGPFSHYKPEGGETGVSLKLHPYWDSIASLLENPPTFPELITSHACPNMCSSFVWVDTLQQLELLAEILRQERVFAVDTEQHSVRSFLGFTALMQISTQKEDFLVDTIALHDMMDILRPIFADPTILKVFHGADNDILWLQRDFHIYVVNLFDTAKACGVLSKPHKSLAYLLETYCGVITNKLLQREDWRMRPLTAEMVNYARTDAHYLLFIASCLALELKSQTSGLGDDGMHEACRRSNTMCLQLYAKEKEQSAGDSAAASIFSRYCTTQESSLNNDQIQELIRRLCSWRDLMARIHDESLRYVLSDQAIAYLSIKVPNGPTGICNTIKQADADKDTFSLHPVFSPSPIVEGHMKDLCCIIQEITENADDVFRRIFQRYLDQKKNCAFSIYNYGLISDFNIKLAKTLFPIQSGGKHDGPLGRKASRQLFVQKFSCKSPVYHNCRIFSSDGRLLCYCDRKKLEWYLRRDLAKLIEDDPPAIMLLFEPKGGPEDEDNEFYIHSKKNICVGCGEKNHYLRYRIIPSCYRMHFPEHLKSHRSHDVVLLCVDCHEIAHTAAEKYKKQVAAEFGIPLFVKKVSECGENEVMTVASNNAEKGNEDSGVSPLQLRTAAMALVRHGSRMPPNRQEELKEIIKSYFGGREISEDDLETALLVGMSAAERRRLERKRGLPFKSSGKHDVCTINESIIEEVSESSVDLSNNANSSYESTFESLKKKCSKAANNDNEKDDIALMSYPEELVVDSLEVGHTLLRQQGIVESAVYSTSEHRTCFSNERNSAPCQKSISDISVEYHDRVEHVTFEKSNIVESCSCITKTAICHCGVNDHESDLPSCENGGSVSYRSVSRKYSKKVSLLGHGPHGRQVVDRLLEEKGGDGILQFSQKWRQIFVDSVHPRFLPAGWDIMHSGRRKFGKYSVYNPNRASEVEEE